MTDGTATGTRSVGSFDFFANLYVSTNLDGVLFAASPEPFRETNLWMSRGAPQSTVPLTAVEGDGSEPRELRRAGNRVAFLACREPQGLWGAGAHEAELVKEGHVDCFSTSGFQPFVSAGESAFFKYGQFVGQSEVWATDGTAASTRKVWDNGADNSSAVYDMAAFGADLLFWTSRVAADQRITSLWRSDGTTAGTTKSLDLPPGVGPGMGSTTLGGELYFGAQSPHLQVWRTDGSAGGTRRLTDAVDEFGQDPEFTRVGSFVYFTGDHGIWRTNGTAAGTILAIPGTQDGDPYGNARLSWLHEQGGALLFMRTENGVSTLWRTQGTPASTQQIAALRAIIWPPRSAASPVGAADGAPNAEASLGEVQPVAHGAADAVERHPPDQGRIHPSLKHQVASFSRARVPYLVEGLRIAATNQGKEVTLMKKLMVREVETLKTSLDVWHEPGTWIYV